MINIRKCNTSEVFELVWKDLNDAVVIASTERTAHDSIAVMMKAAMCAGASLNAGFEAAHPNYMERMDVRGEFIDSLHDLANTFCNDFCANLLMADAVGGSHE